MLDSVQSWLFPDRRLPEPSDALRGPGYQSILVLAIAGAGTAALLILGHWGIAVIGGTAVLALSVVESEPFLLAMVFLIPLGWSLKIEGRVHDVPSAMRALVFAGFFAGRLWSRRTGIRIWLRSKLVRALFLFLAAVLISVFALKTGFTKYSANSLYRTATYVGFFFVILAWADSPGRIRKAVSALLYSTMVAAVFAFLQKLAGGYTSFWLYLNPPVDYVPEWDGRVTSFLNYSNSLAGYLNLILPLALAIYLCGRGRWKVLGGLALGLGFTALVCTQSVGGLGAFVVMLVLAIFCFARNRLKALALLATICALIAGAYLLKQYLNPSHTQETIRPDLAIRFLLWGTAWGYFLQHPVTGIGWGNFVGLYGFDLSGFSSLIPSGVFEVHNIYLQLLAETGVVGFAAFFYFLFHSWQLAWKQWRCSLAFQDVAIAFGVLGAILSVLVHGCVDFLFLVSPQFGTLFWVLLALLLASARLREKPGRRPPELPV